MIKKTLRFVPLLLVVLSCFAITGAIVEPSPSYAEETFAEAETVLGEPTPQSLTAFRRNLIKAAEQSFADKEITRFDLFKIRVASMNPVSLQRMHQACAEQALSEKKFTSYAAIDWAQVIALIKELLPAILEIIKLLSYVPHASPEWFYAGAVMPGVYCGATCDYRDIS